MYNFIVRSIIASILTVNLVACGVSTPTFGLLEQDRYDTQDFVRSVAKHVHCELRRAVRDAYYARSVEFLKDWSAIIVLQLYIDEKGHFGPDLNVSNLFNSAKTELINVGVNGHFNANAIRELKITWYLLFDELIAEKERVDAQGRIKPCEQDSPYSVHGDLKIDEGLNAGIFTSTVMGIVSDRFRDGGPLKTIEHHVNFSIDYGGGVNPALTLNNIVSNSGELFSVNRTRKDDLLITMGPSQLPSDRPLRKGSPRPDPSLFLLNSSLPSQIGQAIRNNLTITR